MTRPRIVRRIIPSQVFDALQGEKATTAMLAERCRCSTTAVARIMREMLDSGEVVLHPERGSGRHWYAPKGWRPPIVVGSIDAIIVSWSAPEKHDEEVESSPGSSDPPIPNARGKVKKDVHAKTKAL